MLANTADCKGAPSLLAPRSVTSNRLALLRRAYIRADTVAALTEASPVFSMSSSADEADMGLSQLFDSVAQTERETCGDTDDQSLDLIVCTV